MGPYEPPSGRESRYHPLHATAAGGTSYSEFYAAALFGDGLTIDNTIIANNTTMNSEGRMSCGNPFGGARTAAAV